MDGIAVMSIYPGVINKAALSASLKSWRVDHGARKWSNDSFKYFCTRSGMHSRAIEQQVRNLDIEDPVAIAYLKCNVEKWLDKGS